MVNALSGSSKYVCVTLAWFNGNCGLRWLAGLKWDVQEFLQCPGKDFGVSGFFALFEIIRAANLTCKF